MDRFEGPQTALTIYSLALRPLVSHYNGPLYRPQTALTIALHRILYFATIIHRYEGPQTALTIALHRGLYLAIIMDRYEGSHTALTITLHGGFCLAIIMDRH
jgi:hypothetical protein